MPACSASSAGRNSALRKCPPSNRVVSPRVYSLKSPSVIQDRTTRQQHESFREDCDYSEGDESSVITHSGRSGTNVCHSKDAVSRGFVASIGKAQRRSRTFAPTAG